MYLKQKKYFIFSLGRSIGEMITVLAIIGLIAASALTGYNGALNKSKANNILHDGKMLYSFAISKKSETTEWQNDIEFISQTKRAFSYKKDFKESIYIQVAEVEKNVCKKLLEFKGKSVNFYTLDNTEFTLCEEINNIIIDFDNNGFITECLTYNDCNGENTYCSSGKCATCEGVYIINEDRTSCLCEEGRTLQEDGSCSCSENKELTCSDKSGNTWCCGGKTICGTELGKDQCIEADEKCSAILTLPQQKEVKYYTDCSYSYTPSDIETTVQYYTDCSIQFLTGSDTLTYKDIDMNTTSFSIKTGCENTDEYCNIYWTEETWGLSETAPIITKTPNQNILYGKCRKRDLNTTIINPSAGNNELPTTSYTPKKSCENTDEYCNIYWTEETWGLSETAPVITKTPNQNILYGKCRKRDLNTTIINPSAGTEGLPTATYQEEKTCPASQYCLLKYSADSCSASLNGNSSGLLYGICVERNTNSGECLY